MSSKYEERKVARENELKEERDKINRQVQQKSAGLHAAHERELDETREKLKKGAEEKKKEILNQRAKQIEEMEALQERLNAITREKLNVRNDSNKMEVEKRKFELEKLQKELEEKLQIRRQQLNDSAEIIKNGEKIRQEMCNKIREERNAEQKKFNEEVLKLNQGIHEIKINQEEKLQKMDEKRIEEQKKRLEKIENRAFSGIANSAQLMTSLAIEDNFEQFRQHCRNLINRHRAFCNSYNSIEAQLMNIDNRMKAGRPLIDFDMEDLLSDLRMFRICASEFNAGGSTDEERFTGHIADVIAIIGELTTEINTIDSKIGVFEEEPLVTDQNGILKEMIAISDKMKEISIKIQLFNVISRDHIQETLADQMRIAHSTRNGRNALEGPPAYETTKKVKPAAITEN
ncbi:Protein containing ALS2cr12 (ALS2CR12) signature [Caenorhabditis elegans]|uniref:Protein containing ALS2cr12 (ALS2CR12) signature n=1 Tax=Caenorhabditis elegans TaxID=6239 RepID=Q95Q93_CAEEL|nr:Protein containing ALS2cr12 (ALS2CR12) signature [Caenorhabditis elegans]CCD62075.1 Protein containing ALS2cr12 (ALS2CR12) signature [Caenorhabditis elegans]|eukprot:NP_505257.1 Downstream of Daf-Nineteen [Caenorhabditis elegans]